MFSTEYDKLINDIALIACQKFEFFAIVCTNFPAFCNQVIKQKVYPYEIRNYHQENDAFIEQIVILTNFAGLS